MAELVPKPQHRVEIDERWVEEWLAYGFNEMNIMLSAHMAFLRYCHDHELAETEEGDAS